MYIKKISFGFIIVLAYFYGLNLIHTLSSESPKLVFHLGKTGQFGDSMAFLALIVLSTALILQSKEFKAQSDAFTKQADEMGNQSNAMEHQTMATLAQSKAIAEQTRAQTLVGITANTEDYIYWLEELKKVYGKLMEQGEADRERIEEAIRQTGNSKALETSLKNISDGYERASELRTKCFLGIEKWQKNRTWAFEQLEKLVMEE
jgi:hypothetical protein